MKQTVRKLRSDEGGAVAIEMAFALPVLVTLMIGILQFALVLQASGAMRHGIGEGLRFAKVNASATAAQVEAETRANMEGVKLTGIRSLTFQRGTASGAAFGRIAMQYELTPVIPFAPLPPIQLNETRTAYLPS